MEHFDVIVVGAGISGIGAAYHLQRNCPGLTYAILEGRPDIGGTWDLFRYPGVRSDSDMHTLGYSFKPWKAAKSIADGPSILEYLRETVAEFGIAPHIRFDHLVQRAEWSSDDARWTVTGTRAGTGESLAFTCNYLFMCSGYYSYKSGYTPEFPGIEHFTGQVIHPQAWPDDLDYAGKRVVVIGSGATAVTLVPAMTDQAAHVTMLQRSPTYVVSRPDEDGIANTLRKVLPEGVAYDITRLKNTTLQQVLYKRMRTQPEKSKAQLLKMVRKELGDDYDVDTHFTPRYNPWDQRMCLVPNSDLFAAISSGRASVVTDQIDTFTETGIRLESGDELEADIVVTATGLQLVTLGEMDFVVDGEPVDFSKTWTYKGFAYSDVPNLASSFGYINASWTLRADLICEYVCRLLNHMDETGTVQCTPRLRVSDADMPERPWIENFTSGYMQRMMHRFPKQGDREPWINPQNYRRDKKMFKKSPVADGVMRFGRARVVESAEPVSAAAG
jgi:monooxygenase